ncbi:MAG: hypothetical protein GXP33_11300 [Spirochaetes bacterium]|nr:hypothetical protein [Spirochaetota bacterium]
MKKRAYWVWILTGFLIMAGMEGCSKPDKQDLHISALEQKLKNQTNNIELVQELLKAYFNANKNDKLISLYESHSSQLEDKPEYRVYYGAALCKKAGASKKIEDKLMWLKKGMTVLDSVVDKNPDLAVGYIWRGVTYANLPLMLGADKIAEGDLDKVLEKYRSGDWKVSQSRIWALSISAIWHCPGPGKITRHC